MSRAYDPTFARAVGAFQPFTLEVQSPDGTVEETTWDRPSIILGRGQSADLLLSDETVSFRHAYLQVISGRIACVDLFSPNSVRWTDAVDNLWLRPQRTFQVGACKITLTKRHWSHPAEEIPSPLEYKPRSGLCPAYGVLPEVELRVLNKSVGDLSWPINRMITLVGRDERCRITCADKDVSAVHCSLVLTPSGLWVVDLLGKGGTLVNGQSVASALLHDQNVIRVGRYRMEVNYQTRPATLPPEDAAQVAFITRLHKIFSVSWDGTTLIVSPQGGIREFRYQDIQLESNSVLSILNTGGFPNLIVDFRDVRLVGSIILESVMQFCRSAKGHVALCGFSPEQQSSLEDMRISTLWPCYGTLAEAICSIRDAETVLPTAAKE